MNPYLEKLQPASFAGFPFFVESEGKTDSGRKIAIHDYPNSGKRYAQDLGALPDSFSVIGVIHGSNFLQNAESFEKLLNTEGRAELILPHLGSLQVVSLPYSVDYSFKSVGVIRYQLKFTISNATEVPVIGNVGIMEIYQKGDELRTFMQDNFLEKYIIPKSKWEFLKTAEDFKNVVIDTVQDYSSTINIQNAKIQKIVRDIQSDLSALIRDPIELAKKLYYGNVALANGLFATFSALFSNEDEEENFKKPNPANVLEPTTFGNDWHDNGATKDKIGVVLWPDDTKERQDKNTNRILAVESARLNALILGYEASANYDYRTADEITSVVILLEEAYKRLILNDSEKGIFSKDNDFKKILDEMKSLTYDYLEQKQQQVFSISSFYFGGYGSVMNLSYKLYAELLNDSTDCEEIAEAMVSLNSTQSPIKFNGTCKIFELN